MTHFLHGTSTTYCGGPNASFNLWWQKRVLTRTLQTRAFRSAGFQPACRGTIHCAILYWRACPPLVAQPPLVVRFSLLCVLCTCFVSSCIKSFVFSPVRECRRFGTCVSRNLEMTSPVAEASYFPARFRS